MDNNESHSESDLASERVLEKSRFEKEAVLKKAVIKHYYSIIR